MALPPPQPNAGPEAASGWMHRGIDLLGINTPDSLEEAVRCFDQAIALRRTRTPEAGARDRYLLAGGWLNRGDALARLGGGPRLAAAMASHDEALGLLRGLPLGEDPLYPRRLAIAWINRGTAVTHGPEAIRCFREALAVLEEFSATAMGDRNLLRAGALTNLAGALLNAADQPNAEARLLTQEAMALVRGAEHDDTAAAEAGLKARHVFCRALAAESRDGKTVPPEWMDAAAAAVDEGMALARHWEERGDGRFRALAEDLFRFGCRLYQSGPSHFLAGFILENLDPEKAAGVLPLNRKTHGAAVAALWSALKEIQRDGFQSISAPGFEKVLENLRDLRVTEARLEQLRRSAAAGNGSSAGYDSPTIRSRKKPC